jgi:hypothetical protein
VSTLIALQDTNAKMANVSKLIYATELTAQLDKPALEDIALK